MLEKSEMTGGDDMAEKSNWNVTTKCSVGDPRTGGAQPVDCNICIDHGQMKVDIGSGRNGITIGIEMEDVKRAMEEYSHS